MNQTCERQSKFGQLPCTQKTAQERVKKISELVGIDSPILILGDDDMVSIELLKQGYQQVTIVDIDADILKAISTALPNAPKRLFKCDLKEPAPLELLNQNYKLVLMDPYYSVEGVKMFLDQKFPQSSTILNSSSI